MEQRNRERTEREVRDLQSSLYAPMSDDGRKRNERSGDGDDDLDECLLQYAIKKSRGNDDDVLDDSILQYAIEKSRDGMSSNYPHLISLAGWLIVQKTFSSRFEKPREPSCVDHHPDPWQALEGRSVIKLGLMYLLLP
jgi:hypothetical protein